MSVRDEPTVRSQDKPIQRLLFVSDAAVADVDELPSPVRAVIDDAAELYVVTPSLPGRLAWLATELNPARHAADERLDTVLDHMRSVGAKARGTLGDEDTMTAFEDAVAEFHPDHILIALRSSEHAAWQERGLIKHVQDRFDLPVTTFAVDQQGHVETADGPLLICYDGSEDAKHAIERAGRLLPGRHALVVTVWQPVAAMGSFAWSGMTASRMYFTELDRSAAEDGQRIADQGVRIAKEAGLEAESGRRPGNRARVEDDHRHRRRSWRGDDRHGFARTHGRAVDAAGKRLRRCREPRRPAHIGHPQTRRCRLTRDEI